MIQLLTRNLGWKLVSLCMAIGLWVVVTREPELTTTVAVPIEFKGVPEDLDIASNLPDRIRLELRGSSGRLAREHLGDLAVILDLSDSRAGERTYNIRASNINLPSGVSFYRAVPSQITLRFEKLLSRDIELAPPAFSNGPPSGYRIQSISLSPSKVRVRGPEQRVLKITHLSEDPVDLSGVVSRSEFHTHVNVGDPQVRLEGPSDITVTVTMEKVDRGGNK